MSSVLSAAENVARQRQNVPRDLKKIETNEERAAELALEGHGLFLICAAQKNILIQ